MFSKVKKIQVGNGFGMVIRCAVDELPEYTAAPDDPYIHNGIQLMAPSVQYMNNAIGDYMQNAHKKTTCSSNDILKNRSRCSKRW